MWHAVADARALHDADLFVAEGRRVVAQVVGDQRYEVVSVLSTPAAAEALRLEDRCRHVLELRSPAEMQSLTGFNFHRGVLALVRRPARRSLPDLLTGADTPRLAVLCEHIVDPDNVGSIFRNARGFGAGPILLDDRCADPLYRKALRTSTGAVLDVPWAVAAAQVLHHTLKAHGYRRVALTPAAEAPSLHEVAGATAGARLALVVGSEGSGLEPQTVAGCDLTARIPMAASADSLNVAATVAVALYAFGTANGAALRPGG